MVVGLAGVIQSIGRQSRDASSPSTNLASYDNQAFSRRTSKSSISSCKKGRYVGVGTYLFHCTVCQLNLKRQKISPHSDCSLSTERLFDILTNFDAFFPNWKFRNCQNIGLIDKKNPFLTLGILSMCYLFFAHFSFATPTCTLICAVGRFQYYFMSYCFWSRNQCG